MPHRLHHRLAIVLAVVVFHVGALWALQNGLLGRAVELVIPVQVLAEFIEPPQPQTEPPRPAEPVTKAAPASPRPRPKAQPLAQPTATPEPTVTAPVTQSSPLAPPATTEPAVAAAPPAPPAPPISPRLELPSSSAEYLNNPRPSYPPLSRRLGEQGKVLVLVYIELDGTASRAEVRQSSGFERLDQTALQTVLRWRYLPGKRAGLPEAMWFIVPINFVLE